MHAGQQVDRYVVEEELGRGGMAVVYRVRHETLRSTHALKVLHTDRPLIAERLVQEGRLQASLKHPNVVSVTDVIIVDGQPGLVMEYLPEGSLEALIGKLEPDEAVAVFRGVVAGVSHAHALGLVHRDLKPANVLIERIDGRIVPKVADFGLAKILREGDEAGAAPGLTRTGVAMGTPAYMAPEQIHDARSADARADIWALGVLLFELLAERRLFGGATALDVMNAVVAGPDPRRVNMLPEPLSTVVRGCTRTALGQRIPDCDTLLAVLGGAPFGDPASGVTFDAFADDGAGSSLLSPPSLAEAEGTTWDPHPAPSPDPVVEPEPSPPAATAVPELDSALVRPELAARAPGLRRGLRLSVLLVPMFAAFTSLTDSLDNLVHFPLLRFAAGPVAADDVVVMGLPAGVPTEARQRHPELIEELVAAGARAIVFDMSFRRAQPGVDDAFASAALDARRQGVPVIAVKRFRGEGLEPHGSEALDAALDSGIAELHADNAFGIVRKIRIRRRTPALEEVWSVAVLAAHALFPGEVRVEANALRVGALRNPIYLDALMLAPSVSPRVVDYGQGLEHTAGKAVFIGMTEGPEDLKRTPEGSRYGVAVLASASQVLMRQRAPRIATPEQNALLTLATGLGTALLAGALPRVSQPLALGVTGSVLAVAAALASAGVLVSILPVVLAGIVGLWGMRKAP